MKYPRCCRIPLQSEGNLGGECIALQLTLEGSFRVILIPFASLNETDQIVIGDSFTDFFVRLMNGDNWFGTKS